MLRCVYLHKNTYVFSRMSEETKTVAMHGDFNEDLSLDGETQKRNEDQSLDADTQKPDNFDKDDVPLDENRLKQDVVLVSCDNVKFTLQIRNVCLSKLVKTALVGGFFFVFFCRSKNLCNFCF